MLISLAEYAVYWSNAFPPSNGVSTTLSPANIVLGRQKPNLNHKYITFGSYALVFVGTKNNMKSRSVPAIALKPSNEWGGYFFLSLITGKRIHAYAWEELPIDDDVVDRIHQLATEENQAVITATIPYIDWGMGNITPSNNKESYEVENEAEDEVNIVEDDEATVIGEASNNAIDSCLNMHDQSEVSFNEDPTFSRDFSSTNNVNDDVIEDQSIESNNDSSNDFFDPDEDIFGDIDSFTDELLNNHDTSHSKNEHTVITNSQIIDNVIEPERTNQVEVAESDNGRPRRARRPVSRLEPTLSGKEHFEIRERLLFQHGQRIREKEKKRMTHRNQITLMMRKVRQRMGNQFFFFQRAVKALFLTAQMNARKGIKLFKERGVAAMIKEFVRLDQGAFPGKPVVEPINADSLTKDELNMAMEAVNILKEKRNGIIKGRTCANGSRQ